MSAQKVPYSSIDTPAVLLDLDQLEANIKEMVRLAADAGVKLRPHIKFHECADIAKMQLESGACGVEVGNVDQAEAMAAEGINDIMIAHPFYGEQKFEKLKGFINKPGLKLSVVVDMVEQAASLSQIGQAVGMKVPVLMKIDTGVNRYGALPGKPALELAKKLGELPGIVLAGIYAHESQAVPTDEGVARVALEVGSITADMARMLRKEGFTITEVTVGASPTFQPTCRYIKEGILEGITELHPGAAAIGDIMYMMSHGVTREVCALTVLTTVVSTSHAGHAVIDVGYKTLGPSVFGEEPSYGPIQGRPDLWFKRIGAESGLVYYRDPEKKLNLGERIEIVPNHGTLVINIHDRIYGVRNGEIEKRIPVTGRGKGS